MARDVTRSDIRRMLERLEKQADRSPAPEPPAGDALASNPGDKGREGSTSTASEYAEAIHADMSTDQIAKFVTIARDFDDTDPDPPDHSGRGTVNTESFVSLSAYSKARSDGTGTVDYLSEADQARLDILTGGGEWIDVTPEDMAAAQRIVDEM